MFRQDENLPRLHFSLASPVFYEGTKPVHTVGAELPIFEALNMKRDLSEDEAKIISIREFLKVFSPSGSRSARLVPRKIQFGMEHGEAWKGGTQCVLKGRQDMRLGYKESQRGTLGPACTSII